MNKNDQAYNLIEEGEYEKAEALGNTLIEEGQIEGYFILTDIAAENEDIPNCIKILQKGIQDLGNNWKLWMRLGNYQSDTDQFENADYSFERAQYSSEADVSLVKLNKAVLASKRKEFDKALNLIEEAREDYSMKCYCLELDILDDQGKYDEVLKSINETNFEEDYDDDKKTISKITFFLANAAYQLGKIKEAIEYVRISLNHNRSNSQSLWLRREMYGKRNKNNKYYRIMIDGDYQDEEIVGQEMGFFTSYDVVANSLESALKEIIEFEPLDLAKDTFAIDEYEILNESSEDPSGIYLTSGFNIYQKE